MVLLNPTERGLHTFPFVLSFPFLTHFVSWTCTHLRTDPSMLSLISSLHFRTFRIWDYSKKISTGSSLSSLTMQVKGSITKDKRDVQSTNDMSWANRKRRRKTWKSSPAYALLRFWSIKNGISVVVSQEWNRPLYPACQWYPAVCK